MGRRRKHIMYFAVVFWHVVHKMENSTYQGSNLQPLLTKPYILLRRFSQKLFSPSFLTSFPGGAKSEPQVLPSSRQKSRLRGWGEDNSTRGFLCENLSGAVLNAARTCSHLAFKSLATANTYWLQKLNADLKSKVIATWGKPYTGVTLRKTPTQREWLRLLRAILQLQISNYGAKKIKISETGQPGQQGSQVWAAGGGKTLNCFGYEEKRGPTKPTRRERKCDRLSKHTHLV